MKLVCIKILHCSCIIKINVTCGPMTEKAILTEETMEVTLFIETDGKSIRLLPRFT